MSASIGNALPNFFAQPDRKPPASSASTQPPSILDNRSFTPNDLSEEEKKVVEDLKETDQKVRSHEQAHKAAAGPYAGPIQYETVTGPDGREYAVGGEVSIDSSPIPGNPRATIQKMETVERAALAPAEPSPQDMAVARAAQAARLQAQEELREQEEAERSEQSGNANNPFQVASDRLKDAEKLSGQTDALFNIAA